MCDTLVALGNSTSDGSVIFAKNSDRDPNEAQNITFIPAKDHRTDELLRCTYISIPQVKHTNAILLSQPFWLWGAEMGANQFGVVIGNEAVFSKVPSNKKPSLTGMDFLRLALERAKNAYDAMYVIIELLERYGQGGNCGYHTPFFYHNSYIIADPDQAWVLETVDKLWIAEKVKDIRSISNAYTIDYEWDLISSHLIDYAIEKKLYDGSGEFNFKASFSDHFFTYFSDSKKRNQVTCDSLRHKKGNISLNDVATLLKSHGARNHTSWTPDNAILGSDVCMHAGFGPARANQTVGSMISILQKHDYTHWITGTAAPCLSIYKPLWFDSLEVVTNTKSKGEFDGSTHFWKYERFHRQVLKDYIYRKYLLHEEQEKIQEKFFLHANDLKFGSTEEKRIFSNNSFERVNIFADKWSDRFNEEPISRANKFYYSLAWNKINNKARITV